MSPKSKRRIAITGLTLIGVLLLSFVVALPALAASCFTDTEFHWAETYVCWLFNNGISSGYPDGTFRPENYITRAEMAVMLQQVAGAGSAGPVANADLLDGYNSSSFAFDWHDHMVAQANKTNQTVSVDSFTEVLAITLSIPDKCSGLVFVDNWNVLVTASGYLSPTGSTLARLGLSLDNAGVIQSGTLRNTDLVSTRVNFADEWRFTGVGSGSHTFRLLAEEYILGDPNYTIYWPVLNAQVMGYSCTLFAPEPEASAGNPDDPDMAP